MTARGEQGTIRARSHCAEIHHAPFSFVFCSAAGSRVGRISGCRSGEAEQGRGCRALLAKLEFFTKGCGGKLTGDALEGVLARVLRDNTLDIKAYEYNVLERAREQHGAAVFCAALGKSLGALP